MNTKAYAESAYKVHISSSFSYFVEHIVCHIVSIYRSVIIALNTRSYNNQDIDFIINIQAPVRLIKCQLCRCNKLFCVRTKQIKVLLQHGWFQCTDLVTEICRSKSFHLIGTVKTGEQSSLIAKCSRVKNSRGNTGVHVCCKRCFSRKGKIIVKTDVLTVI